MTTSIIEEVNLEVPFSLHKMTERFRSLQLKTKTKGIDLEDYVLNETIGKGGFGTVRKAVHKPTGETVAVKVCKTDGLDQAQLECLQREINLQRSLFHQNIAQIYEVIRTDAVIYIVMEYCHNGELFERINRNGPLSEREGALIFHQILSALIYLRQNNISHRDVKPENILFHKNGKAKLIDFGFGCLRDEDEFRRTVCGTPSYTAPEIIKRQPYDPELADVWSLGVTLYAMLAAQLPFEGDTPEKRKQNILNMRYTPQPQLSLKVQKLFAAIFVDGRLRPRLKDLQWTDFALAYEYPSAMSINLAKQSVEVEAEVLNFVELKGVNTQSLAQSVRNVKFDKNRPLYYLSLQKLKRGEPQSNLSSFRKQKKSSVKLSPLCKLPPHDEKRRKPAAKGQQLSSKGEVVGARGKASSHKDRHSERKIINCSPLGVRKEASPMQQIDCPRRLIDSLAAYRFN